MLSFDTNFVREHKISLLDCQIDIILSSLELYSYTYKFVAPRKISETREEDLRISLVRDTYEQILSSYTSSKEMQEEYIKNNTIKGIL